MSLSTCSCLRDSRTSSTNGQSLLTQAGPVLVSQGCQHSHQLVLVTCGYQHSRRLCALLGLSALSLPLCSLTKDVDHRPTFQLLLEHPFIKTTEEHEADIGAWFRDILDREKNL